MLPRYTQRKYSVFVSYAHLDDARHPLRTPPLGPASSLRSGRRAQAAYRMAGARTAADKLLDGGGIAGQEWHLLGYGIGQGAAPHDRDLVIHGKGHTKTTALRVDGVAATGPTGVVRSSIAISE